MRIGAEWLERSATGDVFSKFHAEAGIAAEHCFAPSFADTRWREIADLYAMLERIDPSPLHAMNRAVAMAEWQGAHAGLAVLEVLAPPAWLTDSYLWDAVLSDLHRRAGHVEVAQQHREFELGAPLCDEHGDPLAPVGLILETSCRHPPGKHHCLELVSAQRVALPDTPPMAVHRGRIDLLEQHLRRDPDLLTRTFAHEEIYPVALGCHADHTLALGGTPLDGATLLQMCIDYDEMDIARWLLAKGADVNTRAAVDADGFGGHTALFNCVVAQPGRVREGDDFARLLLDHGADPNVRAALRKQLRFVADESLHEYRDVTPLGWGERFHDQSFVSRPAMKLIAERGGHL